MKKYKFIAGNNLMYNSVHIRRITPINFIFAYCGLVNVTSCSFFADNEEEALKLAIAHFKERGVRRHIMGDYY